MKTEKLRNLCFLLLVFILSGCNQMSSSMSPITAQMGEVIDQSLEAVEIAGNLDESGQGQIVSEEPDYCLDCHTDKQRLIDTAKPQEEVVVESEGEG